MPGEAFAIGKVVCAALSLLGFSEKRKMSCSPNVSVCRILKKICSKDQSSLKNCNFYPNHVQQDKNLIFQAQERNMDIINNLI